MRKPGRSRPIPGKKSADSLEEARCPGLGHTTERNPVSVNDLGKKLWTFFSFFFPLLLDSSRSTLNGMSEVTLLLNAIENGDTGASDRLLPLVYDELRRLAAQKLSREPEGQTLQPTALVHEAYLRLVDTTKAQQWNSRGHFFAAAAESMRRILVENARRKKALRRGGDRARADLNLDEVASGEKVDELLALDEALKKLAEVDRIKAELVQLRYFGGFTMDQAAEMLDVSLATANRYWAYARAWLHQEILSGGQE